MMYPWTHILYQDTFELSGVHAGWRNQYTDRQRYASIRQGNHQSYQQICTELHYTSGEEKDEVQEAEEDEDKL